MDKYNVVFPYNGILFCQEKGVEVLTRATTQRNHEDITPKGRSQT